MSLSRRRFLQGLGAASVLSPLLPLFNAHAQSLAFPKRLMLLTTPDGMIPAGWMPTGSGSNYTLSRILQPLGGTLPSGRSIREMVMPLEGMKLNVGGYGEGHAYGMAGLWTGSSTLRPQDSVLNGGAGDDGGNGKMTGWGSGKSVDQEVADAIGGETLYPSITLAVNPGSERVHGRSFYRGSDQPIAPADDPYNVFDSLFEPLVAEAQELERTRFERRSILDATRADLSALQSRLGAVDRWKLDSHLEAVRGIERVLDGSTSGTCDAQRPGGSFQKQSNGSFRNGDYPAITSLMMDLAANALACDLTRVITLQLSDGYGRATHSWLGHTRSRHSYSHNDTQDPTKSEEADRWNCEQFVYLLRALDSVPEGAGTLLDNTLVVWGKPLGTTGHRRDPAGFIFAGGGGEGIRPGRFVSYSSDQDHNRLLVSILHGMGLGHINSWGNRDSGSGPLSGLA